MKPVEAAKKGKAAKAPASGGELSALRPEQERLVQERVKVSGTLPSALELAGLAASLARGQVRDRDDAREIARQALVLFEACHDHLGKEVAFRAGFNIRKEDELAWLGKIPSPKVFPTTLDAFLRLIVGGKTETDRVALYRDYLRHVLRVHKYCSQPDKGFDQIPETTLEEVNTALARDRREGFNEHWYYQAAGQFLKWREKNRKQLRVEKAKKAAKARRKP